jgi:hypothetical protein
MFSIDQKQKIASQVQRILRDTNHPELPQGEIQFKLRVEGAESWSWAEIRNNGDVPEPSVNSWNEMIAMVFCPKEPLAFVDREPDLFDLLNFKLFVGHLSEDGFWNWRNASPLDVDRSYWTHWLPACAKNLPTQGSDHRENNTVEWMDQDFSPVKEQ